MIKSIDDILELAVDQFVFIIKRFTTVLIARLESSFRVTAGGIILCFSTTRSKTRT